MSDIEELRLKMLSIQAEVSGREARCGVHEARLSQCAADIGDMRKDIRHLRDGLLGNGSPGLKDKLAIIAGRIDSLDRDFRLQADERREMQRESVRNRRAVLGAVAAALVQLVVTVYTLHAGGTIP